MYVVELNIHFSEKLIIFLFILVSCKGRTRLEFVYYGIKWACCTIPYLMADESQELSTCSYPEPDQSSPQHSIYLKGPL
jgi:hypothetical protein